jgi:putative hydrolase of the HAD superfamily
VPDSLPYEGVVFDLFGTLVNIFTREQALEWYGRQAALLGCETEAFMEAWIASWEDRALGRLATTEACIRHVAGVLGIEPDEEAVAKLVRLRRDGTRIALRPRPDAVPTLRRLREAGLKVGLISDASISDVEVWRESALEAEVDVAVFSCLEGTKKPDPAIYRLACRRLGVEPERSLFVGDGGSRELSGADAVGMTAVMIRTAGDGPAAHRYDAEDDWPGPRIASLSETLALVGLEEAAP